MYVCMYAYKCREIHFYRFSFAMSPSCWARRACGLINVPHPHKLTFGPVLLVLSLSLSAVARFLDSNRDGFIDRRELLMQLSRLSRGTQHHRYHTLFSLFADALAIYNTHDDKAKLLLSSILPCATEIPDGSSAPSAPSSSVQAHVSRGSAHVAHDSPASSSPLVPDKEPVKTCNGTDCVTKHSLGSEGECTQTDRSQGAGLYLSETSLAALLALLLGPLGFSTKACMCACICVCMHAYIFMCVCICICIYMYVCICEYMWE